MSSFLKARSRAFVAGADLSSSQYHAVKVDATANQVVAAAAGEGFGIVQTAPISGDECEVAMVGGGALAKLGGTVAYGAELAADANGKFVTAASTDVVLGIALAAGVADDVIEVERVLYVKP